MASRPKSFSPAGSQGIGLVDEQHPAEGAFYDFLGLQGRLAHVSRHEAGAVHLHQLALFQHADGGVDTTQQPGDGGLARAGVAGEHQVQAHGRDGQAVLLPETADFDEVDHALHVPLYVREADEAVQLGHQLVQRGGLIAACGGLIRLGRGRFRRGGGGGRVLVDEGGLAAGDIVRGVERALGGLDARGIADGGQAVGDVGDVLRLGHGHVVVHGRQVQEDVRHHAHEHARAVAPFAAVALGEAPEEHRRQGVLRSADGTREVPEQPGAALAALGVELVGGVHVLLGDGAAAPPEPEGAVGHELVQLARRGAAGDAVKGLCVGGVYLVQLLRRAMPGCGHVDPPLSA